MKRRNTNQKKIVFDVIESFGHISIEKLIAYIKDNYSEISLATIYRNVGILLSENMIKKVKLEEEDVLETVKMKHYHFKCRECNEVIDLPEEFLNISYNSSFDGNDILDDEVSFYGICKKCKMKKGEKNNEEVCM